MPTRMLCAIASVLLVGAVAGCGGGGTDTSGTSGSDLFPQHHAALDFAQLGVGKSLEHAADVLVALLVSAARCAGEADLLGCA